MPIDNAQVIRFANEEVRPSADAMHRLYYQLKAAHQEYFAKGIGGGINAAGAAETIADGSDADGRTPLTGGDVYTWVGVVEAIIAAIEADGRLAHIAKLQVNG